MHRKCKSTCKLAKLACVCVWGYVSMAIKFKPTLDSSSSILCILTSMYWLLHVHDSTRFYLSSSPVTYVLLFLFSAVSPVIARSPSVVNVIEDQQVTLPCVLLAGNPLPERQWLHNYGLVGAHIEDLHLSNDPPANSHILSGDHRPVCDSEEGW